MSLNVKVVALLKLEINDQDEIQTFVDLLTKITTKKFCVGFGIPKLSKEEFELAKDLLKAVREYGFENPELEKTTKISENKNEKD